MWKLGEDHGQDATELPPNEWAEEWPLQQDLESPMGMPTKCSGGGHQFHQGRNVLTETIAWILVVLEPNVGPVEGKEKTDSREGVKANDRTPERTNKATIDTWVLFPSIAGAPSIDTWVPFPSIAGARARVVSPPNRGHLEEVSVHGQRREPQKGREFVTSAQIRHPKFRGVQ